MGGNALADDSAVNPKDASKYPLFPRDSVTTSYWSPHFCASRRNPGAYAGLHFGARDAAAHDALPSDSRGDESGSCDKRIGDAGTHVGKEPLRWSRGGQ